MRGLTGLLVLVLIGACLGGCTTGEPPAASSPVVTPPSTVVSETPQWTSEQQAAIDAVQRYLEVWTYISQNVDEADWDAIYDVAIDPTADEQIQAWKLWADNGWHLVGSPVFVPDLMTLGAMDDKGHRYHLHGCFVIEDSYIADAQGVIVPSDDRIERAAIIYTVIRTPDNKYSVFENKLEDKVC